MWTVPRLAGLLGVILASVFAIVTLVLQVPLFFNQCHEWGSSSAQLILQESGPCSEGVSSSSETRGGALMRTFLIQGGTLLAVGLGLAGVLRGNSAYCVLAAAILFAESVPLVFGGWAALTLGAAALIFWSTRGFPTIDSGSIWGARFVGTVTGAAGGYLLLQVILAVIDGERISLVELLFLTSLLLPMGAAALVGWWPVAAPPPRGRVVMRHN